MADGHGGALVSDEIRELLENGQDAEYEEVRPSVDGCVAMVDWIRPTDGLDPPRFPDNATNHTTYRRSRGTRTRSRRGCATWRPRRRPAP